MLEATKECTSLLGKNIYGLIAKKRVPPNILYVQFSFEHHVKTNEDTEVGFAPRLRELNGLSFDI